MCTYDSTTELLARAEIRLIYVRLKMETGILSGGYHRNTNFQALLNYPRDLVLSIIAEQPQLDWCDFELIATILGSDRPSIPLKAKGKYNKIHKIYWRSLASYRSEITSSYFMSALILVVIYIIFVIWFNH